MLHVSLPTRPASGKLVLSDRCHAADEDEYRGMIWFVSLRELAGTYTSLLSANRTFLKKQVSIHTSDIHTSDILT